MIWNHHLLKEQGCKIRESVFYQDNQRAIKLENNASKSSSKRTRHINIRYYFITDLIKNEKVPVEFYPTLDIIGDYFTNALQGSQFLRFCYIILSMNENDIHSYNFSGRAFLDKNETR